MSDPANQQSTSKMVPSLFSTASKPEHANPTEKVLDQISEMMKRIIVKNDNYIRLSEPRKKRKVAKRVQIKSFLFEPDDILKDDQMITFHRECTTGPGSGAVPSASQMERADTFSSFSDNSGEGSENMSKSDEDDAPIETSPRLMESRRATTKAGVFNELDDKLEEGAVAQSVIRRLRNAGSALMEVGPEYYKKSCYSYHFQEVRRRLIRLIGRPAIRINDHAAMKELQLALEKEAEEEAEAHERRLAAEETKRIQALILTGVLDVSALKQKRFTDDDRIERPSTDPVTIKSRSEDEGHLDFRRYTRNPTAAKYNALHVAEKVDKLSSDPIVPRERLQEREPRKTSEAKTNILLGETAHMLQDILESSGALIPEDSKQSTNVLVRRIKIPRMSFAESRLRAAEVAATEEVVGVQELFDTAENFVKHTDFLQQWPQDMRQCFAVPDSFENIPHLEEYSYNPDENNDLRKKGSKGD